MKLTSFVLYDLLRNPRRTLASMSGVIVGVGLFSAVLFFIDGSGASMTRRAIAPLPLDVQRVLTAPTGGGIRFERKVSANALGASETAVVTLTVTNEGIAPANEVVIRDSPAAPLTYVPRSTRLGGKAIADVAGGIPLSQGSAGTGLNVNSVEPNSSLRITYRVKAREAVVHVADLPEQASISTREAVTPTPANGQRATPLPILADEVAAVPGIRSADPLAFVDMAAGSIAAGDRRVPGPVKLFAFDAAYQSHYPDIKLLSGAIEPGGVLISAEAARELSLSVGDTASIRLPGQADPLSLAVSAITDLSNSKQLFYSRESSSLEEFKYVPFTVVVSPETYRQSVVPAFEAAAARRGARIASLPLEEVDILLDRGQLNSDPATAVDQTLTLASAIKRVAPGQDYLIDNISNTLQVAKGDAAVAKRMFIFLGLPGAVLAAILTAYAGVLLAGAQRKENALLRVRGADRRQLLSLLALRTGAIAGLGSVLGVALGFISVLVLLGRSILFEASGAALAQSAAIGVGGGIVVTAMALYLPGRRLITQEINQDLAVVSGDARTSRRRVALGLLALIAAGIAQVVAGRLGAFDAPAGSVYSGVSVTLPLHLLIAPIVAWLAGTLFIAHLLHAVVARRAPRDTLRFGRLLTGVLWRSVTRRLSAMTSGVVAVGLVVGLGTMLACFATTYDRAKVADARFLVGSSIRLTPNPTSPAAHPTSLAGELRTSATTGATAVVFSPENTTLTSEFNEDVATMAAVDPSSYSTVAALEDSVFSTGSATQMMTSLRKQPAGVFVNVALADGLKVNPGDTVRVLFARGTDQQTRSEVTVLGLFTQFPGAPKATDVVANLDFYKRTTGLDTADYYLVGTADPSGPAIRRAVSSLASLPDFTRRFDVQTSVEALDQDQSSLTALNVRGLLQLDSFYTFLMAAVATAMFVFGLLLQRRREYVTLRAQGLPSAAVRRLVLAEAALSSTLGAAIGLIVGTLMATQFIHVLRPIFTLPPAFGIPVLELLVLAALVLLATVLSSAAAALIIGRLKPTELLRDD